jgi:hypothetical protein
MLPQWAASYAGNGKKAITTFTRDVWVDRGEDVSWNGIWDSAMDLWNWKTQKRHENKQSDATNRVLMAVLKKDQFLWTDDDKVTNSCHLSHDLGSRRELFRLWVRSPGRTYQTMKMEATGHFESQYQLTNLWDGSTSHPTRPEYSKTEYLLLKCSHDYRLAC